MIHTASLVHDDVVDNCSVRRGEALASGAHVQDSPSSAAHAECDYSTRWAYIL